MLPHRTAHQGEIFLEGFLLPYIAPPQKEGQAVVPDYDLFVLRNEKEDLSEEAK